MAERRLLPDLRPQLPGLERGRCRRPAGHPLPVALPAGARRRRALADAVLPVAAGRPWLRRRRLCRRRPTLRHARRLRRARRRRARARDQGDDRHRSQPHLRPARVVPERDRRPDAPRPEALHVPTRTERRAAERLDVRLRRPRLDARRADGRVLPPFLRARATRSRLAPRGRAGQLRRDPPLLARPRGRRLPDRRRACALQGAGPAGDGRADAASAVRRLALGPDAARAAPALPPLAPDRRRVSRRPDVRQRDHDREPGHDRELRRAGPAEPVLRLHAPPRAVGRRADASDDRPRPDDARRRRRAGDLGLREP